MEERWRRNLRSPYGLPSLRPPTGRPDRSRVKQDRTLHLSTTVVAGFPRDRHESSRSGACTGGGCPAAARRTNRSSPVFHDLTDLHIRTLREASSGPRSRPPARHARAGVWATGREFHQPNLLGREKVPAHRVPRRNLFSVRRAVFNSEDGHCAARSLAKERPLMFFRPDRPKVATRAAPRRVRLDSRQSARPHAKGGAWSLIALSRTTAHREDRRGGMGWSGRRRTRSSAGPWP